MPRLILVTGPSGAGKTTLARGFSAALDLAVLHKDDLKEVLFDVLPDRGSKDRTRFGVASFVPPERLARAILPHASLIVEANFHGRLASPVWRTVIEETGAETRVLDLDAPLRKTSIPVVPPSAPRSIRSSSRGSISASRNCVSPRETPESLLARSLAWLGGTDGAEVS